ATSSINLNAFSGQFNTNGDHFIALSGSDINFTGNGTINTAASSGAGGAIVLGAGVRFDPNTNQITGATATGGNISAAGLNLNSAGGSITLRANSGTGANAANGGQITLGNLNS